MSTFTFYQKVLCSITVAKSQIQEPRQIRIILNYRVIFDKLHQELTCYRLVLSLLRVLKASM